MTNQQQTPTPRTDKLRYEEACNFEVSWEEEYEKLEREAAILKGEIAERDRMAEFNEKAYQELLAERDRLRQALQKFHNQVTRSAVLPIDHACRFCCDCDTGNDFVCGLHAVKELLSENAGETK